MSKEENELLNSVSEMSLALEDARLDIETYKDLSDKFTELEIALTKFLNSLDKK